jgi:hypothetical protein
MMPKTAGECGRSRASSDQAGGPVDRDDHRVDGLVTLGGDGTMPGGMRLVIDRPVPVLGVNHGNLGFLLKVAPDQLPSALKRLARGSHHHRCHPPAATHGLKALQTLLSLHIAAHLAMPGSSRRENAALRSRSVPTRQNTGSDSQKPAEQLSSPTYRSVDTRARESWC